ncbi:MAG TPA: hypothetical protein VHO69_19465 [Phototrophicaceae bacterium]|nr:hypothetical protein [Phototrophicaceae bacterium]
MKTLIKSLRLRQNWPLVLAVGLVCLTVLIWFSTPSQKVYRPQANQTVNYWLLLVQYGGWRIWGTLILAGLFLAALIGAVFISKRQALIALLLFIGSIAYAAYTCLSNLGEGTSIVHIQSLMFDQRIYHLARVTSSYDLDSYSSGYVVYECDVIGLFCHSVYEVRDMGYYVGRPTAASFWIDIPANSLHLRVGENETLFVPIVSRRP